MVRFSLPPYPLHSSDASFITPPTTFHPPPPHHPARHQLHLPRTEAVPRCLRTVCEHVKRTLSSAVQTIWLFLSGRPSALRRLRTSCERVPRISSPQSRPHSCSVSYIACKGPDDEMDVEGKVEGRRSKVAARAELRAQSSCLFGLCQ